MKTTTIIILILFCSFTGMCQEKVVYKVSHQEISLNPECPYGIKDCKSKHYITVTETFCNQIDADKALYRHKYQKGKLDSVIYRRVWQYRMKYLYKNTWLYEDWQSSKEAAEKQIEEQIKRYGYFKQQGYELPRCLKVDSALIWKEEEK